MAIGILRVRNLKINDLGSVQEHNAREYENEKKFPSNIEKGGTFHQTYYDRGDDETQLKLQDLVQKRIKEDEIKLRKNSNVAIEIVMTINDKKAWDNYSFSGFNSNSLKFLEDKFGEGSVLAKYEHLDESNPHVHFVVLPTVKKEVKWKNQKGEGSKEQVRIDTSLIPVEPRSSVNFKMNTSNTSRDMGISSALKFIEEHSKKTRLKNISSKLTTE
jgi:hypothetical protein